MKNTYIFSLICSLLFIFTNCNDDLNISRTDRANSAGTSTQELILDKKGIGMSYKELTWSTRIGRLKPFWHYSWNRDLKNNIPDSVEYVPMFWGANSVNDSEINRIRSNKSYPEMNSSKSFIQKTTSNQREPMIN